MKRGWLTLLLVGGGMLLFDRGDKWRAPARRAREKPAPKDMAITAATHRSMMYVLLPAWLISSVLAWIWHRQRAEKANGVRGPILHSLMVVEAGLPVLAGLFLEISAGAFAFMSGTAALHEATAFWYVRHLVPGREWTPRERRTYNLMEMVPLAAVSFAACLHPKEFTALFGGKSEEREFGIHWRRPALPVWDLVGVIAAISIFVVAPCVKEIRRCCPTAKRPAGRDLPKIAQALFGKLKAS